ncbi:hypothetical protein Tco_0026398 [Tanacetum coccineum]
MDSIGLYHTTYKKDYLVEFEKYDGGGFLLSDSTHCHIRETVSTLETKGFPVKGSGAESRLLRVGLWYYQKKRDTSRSGLVEEMNMTLKAPTSTVGFLNQPTSLLRAWRR